MVELYHFGDQCAPGIIIDDILKINKKTLFMLGFYSFNNILYFLQDNNYEQIYNRDNLIVETHENVRHNKYNFVFNHDYKITDWQINNYDFIRDRFDVKIRHFREMLSSEDKCIFITFTSNVDSLKIQEMLEWLTHNKRNFYLVIFTHNEYSNTQYFNNCSIIKLDNSYEGSEGWWQMEYNKKKTLYNEIYGKFLQCLNNNNIWHNFPSNFEM